MIGFNETLASKIGAAMREENARLESLLRQSLIDLFVSGERRGIAVIESPAVMEETGSLEGNDYGLSMTWNTEIGLDPRVPFANIYRFPSREAFDAWVERGCPTQ